MPTQLNSVLPYPSQRVVVLRHGERRDSSPDAPAESNPPLTKAGVVAIKALAARLKHHLGDEAAYSAALVVSPFLRTLQTAEVLQHYGVGAARSMLIDNTLCEVFGPIRVTASRAPELSIPPKLQVVGQLPAWGESIEMAAERYVSSFLRSGDFHGGVMAATPSFTNSSCTNGDDSTSRNVAASEAVMNRKGGRLPPRKTSSKSLTSWKEKSLSTSSESPLLDVILVTHGDALGSVIAHFYPARIVYETEFLSFVIMRRYGVGNPVYHLDQWEGVNWIVEGVDAEPRDPILSMLEEQRGAHRGKNGSRYGKCGEDERSSFEDEADQVENNADVPFSFAGGRMRRRQTGDLCDNSHANHCVPSTPGSLMESVPPSHAANPLAPHNGLPAKADYIKDIRDTSSSLLTQTCTPPQPRRQVTTSEHHYQCQMRSNASQHHFNGQSRTFPTVDAPEPPHCQLPVEYPKAGEDCERIRLPAGTPAQSSSNSVTINNNGRNLAECENDKEAVGGGNDRFQCVEGRMPLKKSHSAAGHCYMEEEWESQQRVMPNDSCHDSTIHFMGSCGEIPVNESTDSSVQPPAMLTTATALIVGSPPSPHLKFTGAVASPELCASYGSALTCLAVKSFEADLGKNETVVREGISRVARTQLAVDSVVAVDASGGLAEPLNRRVCRERRVVHAAFVSSGLRVVAAFLIILNVLVQPRNTGTLWFGVFAVSWEVGFAAVMYFSCRPDGWRMRRLRSAVEQLHLLGCNAKSRATAHRPSCVVAHRTSSHDGTCEVPVSVQTRHHRGCSRAGGAVHMSSVEWQDDTDGFDGDVPTTNSVLKGTMTYVLCGSRLIAATALKLFIISTMSFVCALLCGSPASGAMTGIYNVYGSTAGALLLLAYGCICVARGLWDETKLDAALDGS
ncbi:hypothetical protein, conserved [Leishmania tarentolae]|uniref:Uncharacterized protein n=1 Tax=Leishmania tarentolae TaxID=5689 RepID=A0A640KZ66_LEITA|nr:hypothetical protein, conserved [Leishmania tarentolae]